MTKREVDLQICRDQIVVREKLVEARRDAFQKLEVEKQELEERFEKLKHERFARALLQAFEICKIGHFCTLFRGVGCFQA